MSIVDSIRNQFCAYLVTSLASMILLNSFTANGLIHTVKWKVGVRWEYRAKTTYSLFESNCHFYSLSYWRIADDHGNIQIQGIRGRAFLNDQYWWR